MWLLKGSWHLRQRACCAVLISVMTLPQHCWQERLPSVHNTSQPKCLMQVYAWKQVVLRAWKAHFWISHASYLRQLSREEDRPEVMRVTWRWWNQHRLWLLVCRLVSLFRALWPMHGKICLKRSCASAWTIRQADSSFKSAGEFKLWRASRLLWPRGSPHADDSRSDLDLDHKIEPLATLPWRCPAGHFVQCLMMMLWIVSLISDQPFPPGLSWRRTTLVQIFRHVHPKSNVPHALSIFHHHIQTVWILNLPNISTWTHVLDWEKGSRRLTSELWRSNLLGWDFLREKWRREEIEKDLPGNAGNLIEPLILRRCCLLLLLTKASLAVEPWILQPRLELHTPSMWPMSGTVWQLLTSFSCSLTLEGWWSAGLE